MRCSLIYLLSGAKRVKPNKRVGWIFKYTHFIKEYLGPNKRVEWKICYPSRVENVNE